MEGFWNKTDEELVPFLETFSFSDIAKWKIEQDHTRIPFVDYLLLKQYKLSFRTVLQKGIYVDRSGKSILHRMLSLHEYITEHDIAIFIDNLKQPKKVLNLRDSDQITPIMLALLIPDNKKCWNICKLLVGNGSDVNYKIHVFGVDIPIYIIHKLLLKNMNDDNIIFRLKILHSFNCPIHESSLMYVTLLRRFDLAIQIINICKEIDQTFIDSFKRRSQCLLRHDQESVVQIETLFG